MYLCTYVQCLHGQVYAYTVEPLYKGHVGTIRPCYKGFLNLEVI